MLKFTPITEAEVGRLMAELAIREGHRATRFSDRDFAPSPHIELRRSIVAGLRRAGKTYGAIVAHLRDEGIDVTLSTVKHDAKRAGL